MKRNKKLITLVLLALLCLGLAVTGSLAAFTKTNYIKRVVSTKPGSSDQWSSNYLQPIFSDNVKEQSYRLGGSLDLGITVCNYPQGDITRYSSSTITFALKLEFENSIGSKIKIKSGSDSSSEGTPLSSYDQETTYTLSGGTPSTILFSFTCSEIDAQSLSDCLLTVKAVPISSEIKTLACTFRFTSTTEAKTTWNGKFIEDQTSPASLDAFNYEITGSEQGSITLTIQTDKVQISKFSYEELMGSLPSGIVDSLTFNVGGEGQPTRYVIQFYRTSEDKREDETIWDGIANYVQFIYTPTPSST